MEETAKPSTTANSVSTSWRKSRDTKLDLMLDQEPTVNQSFVQAHLSGLAFQCPLLIDVYRPPPSSGLEGDVLSRRRGTCVFVGRFYEDIFPLT